MLLRINLVLSQASEVEGNAGADLGVTPWAPLHWSSTLHASHVSTLKSHLLLLVHAHITNDVFFCLFGEGVGTKPQKMLGRQKSYSSQVSLRERCTQGECMQSVRAYSSRVHD